MVNGNECLSVVCIFDDLLFRGPIVIVTAVVHDARWFKKFQNSGKTSSRIILGKKFLI